MIEFKICVDDIDFDGAADTLLELLADQIASSDDNPMLKKLMSFEKSPQAIKGIIAKLPQGTKEQLTASLIKRKRSDIRRELEKLAQNNGVKLSVIGVTADQIKQKER